MKPYFLLVFSLMFLLLTLPDSGKVNSKAGMEQAVRKKACSGKRLVKRTCAKKCIKHPTHSRQQNALGSVVDCGTQLYAALLTQEREELHEVILVSPTSSIYSKKHSSPHLEADPDPPRFS